MWVSLWGCLFNNNKKKKPATYSLKKTFCSEKSFEELNISLLLIVDMLGKNKFSLTVAFSTELEANIYLLYKTLDINCNY